MRMRRILLVAVGLLIAVGAAILVARGFRGFVQTPSPAGASPAGEGAGLPAAGQDGGEDEDERPPRWEDFVQPGPPAASLPRPIAGAEIVAGSPFDHAPGRAELERLALRLEGVGLGDRPLALISGRVVGIGEMIEGFRVARIEHSGVSLVNPAGVRIDLVPGVSTAPADSRAGDPPSEARREARTRRQTERPSSERLAPRTRPPGGS